MSLRRVRARSAPVEDALGVSRGDVTVPDLSSDAADNCASGRDAGSDEDSDFVPSLSEDGDDSDLSSFEVPSTSVIRMPSHREQCTCLARFSVSELQKIRAEAATLDLRFKAGLLTGMALSQVSRDMPFNVDDHPPPQDVSSM